MINKPISIVVLTILITLMVLNSCKKEHSDLTQKDTPASSLVNIAKQSLNTVSSQGKTYATSLQSIGMVPDWSKALTRINSKKKTVLAVPLERSATTYTELNMVATNGVGHTVFKRYTISEDGSVTLEFYALDGSLLKTGIYNPQTKLFKEHKLVTVKVSLFTPKNSGSSDLSLQANNKVTMSAHTGQQTFKALTSSSGKTTDDPDKGDGEDLDEVVIVGKHPTPPPPPEDPFYVPELPTGPADYYPTDPVSQGGGSEGQPTEQQLVEAFIKKIDTSQLKPCMKKVLNSLTNLQGGSIPQIIKLFSGTTPGYNWKLVDGVLPAGTNGQTDGSYNSSFQGVVTKFDGQKYTAASDLAIARTIMHESVHAFLVDYFHSNTLMAQASYPELVQQWINTKNPSLNDIQHDNMVNTFVGQIAASLSAYGDQQGYTFSTNTEKTQFYNDLAWGGLTNTKAFTNFPAATQARINDRLLSEQYQTDSNGNSKPSKGKIGGC